MTKPKLTVKEQKLIKGVVEGKSQTEAYLNAYSTNNRKVASVEGSRVLAKPSVQEALQAALEKHGITPERTVQRVSEALDAKKINIVRDPMGGEESAFAEETPDHAVRLKAVTIANNLMGLTKPAEGGGNTFVQINNDMRGKYV